MSRLPKQIRNRLKKEAREWDIDIAAESPEQVENLLGKAQSFKASRPPRKPVSIRLDPFDISMVKRLAREKGIPHSQLMAMWVHERVEQEKKDAAGC